MERDGKSWDIIVTDECWSLLTSCSHSLQGLTGADIQRGTFSDAWKQFWPDAIADATDDSYDWQLNSDEGSLGASRAVLNIHFGAE